MDINTFSRVADSANTYGRLTLGDDGELNAASETGGKRKWGYFKDAVARFFSGAAGQAQATQNRAVVDAFKSAIRDEYPAQVADRIDAQLRGREDQPLSVRRMGALLTEASVLAKDMRIHAEHASQLEDIPRFDDDVAAGQKLARRVMLQADTATVLFNGAAAKSLIAAESNQPVPDLSGTVDDRLSELQDGLEQLRNLRDELQGGYDELRANPVRKERDTVQHERLGPRDLWDQKTDTALTQMDVRIESIERSIEELREVKADLTIAHEGRMEQGRDLAEIANAIDKGIRGLESAATFSYDSAAKSIAKVQQNFDQMVELRVQIPGADGPVISGTRDAFDALGVQQTLQDLADIRTVLNAANRTIQTDILPVLDREEQPVPEPEVLENGTEIRPNPDLLTPGQRIMATREVYGDIVQEVGANAAKLELKMNTALDAARIADSVI
ncbi:MAG: hypothetical protein ACU0BF_06165 [Paracoccaceae bacterium]